MSNVFLLINNVWSYIYASHSCNQKHSLLNTLTLNRLSCTPNETKKG